MKVLFVCRANTGRSQMAEELFNSLSQKGHADSAGVEVDRNGQTIEERIIEKPNARYVKDVMNEIGIDISNNIRTQLTPNMLEDFDKVVVMAEPEITPNYLIKSPKYVYWKVDDPLGSSLENTRKTRDEIKEKVFSLLKSLLN
jgi:arsenate reductase